MAEQAVPVPGFAALIERAERLDVDRAEALGLGESLGDRREGDRPGTAGRPATGGSARRPGSPASLSPAREPFPRPGSPASSEPVPHIACAFFFLCDRFSGDVQHIFAKMPAAHP